ncbi:putative lysophospholipase plb1 [Erysiphe necator]|uniref:Lysophospholipase n=1 Tax=Uncinula necator TaxID=52586 RepID=A0A0B1P5L9_UNCNE|nr:putative lysophospholipase plb1 [Erysiphe necator]
MRKILNNIKSKQEAGFNVSATDFWGRALSFQLIDAPDGGPAYTFSSIALQDDFKDGSIPLPMLVATRSLSKKAQNSVISNVFEMNPFELGTWDTNIAGFAPMEYIGSNFSGGTVPFNDPCVKGFDQVGFLIGATSTIFEVAISRFAKSKRFSLIRNKLQNLKNGKNNVAHFQPNPFFGFNPDVNPTVKSKDLSLVDGGLDKQNLPLLPLLQQSRKVDVIFAVDSSANLQNFPNGTALVATYERALKGKFNSKFSFPSIPDQNTFVNLGLNKRPTFFGCDASNITGDAPLIVYIPNSKYSAASNTSTFKRKYSESLRNQIIQNGYEFSTQANGTVDPQWPVCIGCAALSRSMTRTRTPIPTACQNCFSSYCWDGTLNQSYVEIPVPVKKSRKSFFGRFSSLGSFLRNKLTPGPKILPRHMHLKMV